MIGSASGRSFLSGTLIGTYYKIFDQSVFKKYFEHDDPDAMAWADNVLQKLIEKGIVPNYVLREYNESETDYAELYRPITIFFSYLVRLAREFRDFKNNDFLADQYLLNTGQFTCGDESLNQLLYLISNLLRVRAYRGSIKMIEKSNAGSVPHGELLRLMCWHENIFFKLGVAKSQHNSWNVNNSGPLYKGNTNRYDLNIGYENTESVLDLSKYPIINGNYVFLSTYRGKECLEIEGVPGATISGIGANDSSKRIVVTPELNFEITFYIAQDTTLENITFGCLAFDINGDQVPLQDIVTGGNSNFFFETRRLNQPGRFYMVRGILYQKDYDLQTADRAKLNIGFGHNLRMTEDVVSIIPYIIVDNVPGDDVDIEQDNFPGGAENDPGGGGDPAYDGSPSVYIWNLKVSPCSLLYERSYLNNKNFIDLLLDNRNGKYTDKEITDILRKEFIPYNTAFNVTYLDSIISIANDSYLLLEDGDYILLEDNGRIPLEL